MAKSARSSVQRSAGASKYITRGVVDELRMILDGGAQVRSLVADCAVRHRLTHRDVNALLVALADDDATGRSLRPSWPRRPPTGPPLTIPPWTSPWPPC